MTELYGLVLEIATSTRNRHAQNLHLHTERSCGVGVPRTPIDEAFELYSRPDYAFWYGGVEETELNVVVVEAKAEGESGLNQMFGLYG